MIMEQNVMFNDETKKSLVDGVNLIGNAVGTTFGPMGKNVIINYGTGIHITKDGATVAAAVNSPDRGEQLAIDVVRDISVQTAKQVGDGTTTVTLLTQALVNAYKDYEGHPIELQRELQKSQQDIITYIESQKLEISSFEDIKKVATISANNDPILGDLIAQAYNVVGKYGVVNIDESSQVENSYEAVKGLQIESGYASPFFINTPDNTCIMDNVLVYITQEKIKENSDIIPIVNEAMAAKKSLLFIATDMDTSVQQTLFLNNAHKTLHCCFVKCPHHGVYKDTIIDDVKRILGSSMSCEKIVISKDSTTFIGCNSDYDNTDYIEEIKYKLKQPEISPTEEKFHTKRLANFLGGVCTIKVGGYSEAEIREKKDRVEDAICATKAALEGGVLPGGGIALLKAADNVDNLHPTFRNTLKVPYQILLNNAGLASAKLDKQFWNGTNLKTGEFGNMYDLGVIDPFLVTKTVIENAVNTATLILTNGCAIFKTNKL